MTDTVFQTKSLAGMCMDRYELRADGTLWHEEYDIGDRSDPEAEEVERLLGAMSRVNPRWERENFTGEVRFYDLEHTFLALLVEGHIKGEIQRVRDGR